MAEVYQVRHDGLARREALKALPPALAADATFVARFLTEARTAASLHHPHIAVIYAVSEADAPQPYFTMELVNGGDLADYLAEHPRLSLSQARPFLEQIAAALDYAHARGLMHRDVKPANVMLTEAGDEIKVKLVDFGLARAHTDNSSTRLTQTGMMVGTPEYMSPEQIGSGAPVGARTDQYALAIIAYEMLCGTLPFCASEHGSAMAALMAHLRDAPRAPIELAPNLPKAANAAILRALAKNPDDRFASCGAFVEALYGSVSSVNAPIKSDVVEAKTPLSRAPLWIGMALLGGVALLGYSAWSNSGNGEIEVSAPTAIVASTDGATTEGATTEGATPDGTIPDAAQPQQSAPVAQAPAQSVGISVPQIVGKTEAQAREILRANGLAADVTTGYSEAFDAQQVMSQYPAPGAPIRAGAPVRFRISVGSKNPRVVRVPVERERVEQAAPAPAEDAVPDEPVVSSGTWLVIFGSFPHSRADDANAKLRRVLGAGYDAHIIDTDNYSGLANGLYAIVSGPFSKSDARRQLAGAKSSFSDAYIKSG